MAAATQTAAKSNASAKFSIVDFPKFPPTIINALVFNTVQDGFLGGYLAAGMTKTGKVGDVRRPEAADRDHLHGRLRGRRPGYNAKHHTHVKVLGWTEKTQGPVSSPTASPT